MIEQAFDPSSVRVCQAEFSTTDPGDLFSTKVVSVAGRFAEVYDTSRIDIDEFAFSGGAARRGATMRCGVQKPVLTPQSA